MSSSGSRSGSWSSPLAISSTPRNYSRTLPQPTVALVCASSMVVRRVHQHADLGLKTRRMPVQNMMLLLHVDASLNTERLAHRVAISVVLQTGHCWKDAMLRGHQWPGYHSR